MSDAPVKQRARPWQIALAVGGALVGIYEATAVTTDAVPTVTETILDLPAWLRFGMVGLIVGAVIDHLGTRRWL